MVKLPGTRPILHKTDYEGLDEAVKGKIFVCTNAILNVGSEMTSVKIPMETWKLAVASHKKFHARGSRFQW